MTKLLSILAVSAFLIIGGFSTASAHCGSCGAQSHGEMKPCTKCVKAGKACNCHAKKAEMKPCEKKLGGEKKPCAKCAESERAYHAKKKSSLTGSALDSNIGSLQIRSRGHVDTGYND